MRAKLHSRCAVALQGLPQFGDSSRISLKPGCSSFTSAGMLHSAASRRHGRRLWERGRIRDSQSAHRNIHDFGGTRRIHDRRRRQCAGFDGRAPAHRSDPQSGSGGHHGRSHRRGSSDRHREQRARPDGFGISNRGSAFGQPHTPGSINGLTTRNTMGAQNTSYLAPSIMLVKKVCVEMVLRQHSRRMNRTPHTLTAIKPKRRFHYAPQEKLVHSSTYSLPEELQSGTNK